MIYFGNKAIRVTMIRLSGVQCVYPRRDDASASREIEDVIFVISGTRDDTQGCLLSSSSLLSRRDLQLGEP